jgi:hypothetical protein
MPWALYLSFRSYSLMKRITEEFMTRDIDRDSRCNIQISNWTPDFSAAIANLEITSANGQLYPERQSKLRTLIFIWKSRKL